MPVIVVGADTNVGDAVVEIVRLSAPEVRAFVTDEDAAASLKERGVKVAIGDVSDSSHVEAAALNCFCAVLATEAALDGRERAFAHHFEAVVAGWAAAARNAGVTRVIWVTGEDLGVPFPESVPEVAVVPVGESSEETARTVGELEGAATL